MSNIPGVAHAALESAGGYIRCISHTSVGIYDVVFGRKIRLRDMPNFGYKAPIGIVVEMPECEIRLNYEVEYLQTQFPQLFQSKLSHFGSMLHSFLVRSGPTLFATP